MLVVLSDIVRQKPTKERHMVEQFTERVTVRMDPALMDLLRRAAAVYPGTTPSSLIRDWVYEMSGRARDMIQACEDMQSDDPIRQQRGLKLSAALHETALAACMRVEQVRVEMGHADASSGSTAPA
jgi:hypothetical protein